MTKTCYKGKVEGVIEAQGRVINVVGAHDDVKARFPRKKNLTI